MRTATLLLAALLTLPAWAQQPAPKQLLPTPVLGLMKCGERLTGGFKKCVNPNADRMEACRARLGTFAARPAEPPCPTALYIVTDCATTACLAGGGSIHCLTRADDAGTAWEVGVCDGSGSGSGPGVTVMTTCTDGGSNNAAAVQSAVDALTATGGTVLVPSGAVCGIGTTVTLKSNVHIRCEGGGFKARSGVGASGMFVGATTLANASITGCDMDLSSLSGIEGVSITGAFSNIAIARNRFRNWANAFAVELYDTDSEVGRDSWVTDNLFEGSGVLATNDSGLRLYGFDSGFIIVNDEGLVSAHNRFRRLGGVNIQAGGSAKLIGDEVEGLRRQAVLADGPVTITGMGVTGADGGAVSLSNRYAIFTLNSTALLNGVGVQSAGGKVIVEHLGGGLLSIANSFLAGGGADSIVTGTASSTSSTITVHEASKSWTINEWVDYELVVQASGGGCAVTPQQRRWITGNTSNTLTFTPALPAQADSCTYKIVGAGMVVSRKPAYVQITGSNFDNASVNYTNPDFDQLVIYDATVGVTIGNNVFSGVHPTGHAGIRLVSSEAYTTNFATGTADGASTAAVIQPTVNPNWTTNAFVGAWAELTGGSCAAGGAGTKRRIVLNTGTGLVTDAFAGATAGCTFAIRKYDFAPTTISGNVWPQQCPAAVCGTYGCIEYDRQVSGGGTFRGQTITGNDFTDATEGAPRCRPVDGWSLDYGRTDPGGLDVLTGSCLQAAGSTYYLGTGCTATEANTRQTVTEHVEVSALKCMVDSGSGSVCTLRKNGADTALACTQAAGVGCTDTGTVRFAPGDTRDVKIVAPGSGGCNATTTVGCLHHVELTIQP